MAINTAWSITDIKRNASDGGVIEVSWKLESQADTGETATESGKMICEPDPSAPGFIAFDDLTESDVLGWVKTHLGDDEVARIEADRAGKVQAQIDRKAATATGLPWS